MLLQKRAKGKYHSGGLWSNACCGHPNPDEEINFAALRRLNEELGFTVPLTKTFDFSYKISLDNGLIENEFDHVFVGEYDGDIHPAPEEVSDYTFKTVGEIRADLSARPGNYTGWFRIAFPMVEQWLNNG